LPELKVGDKAPLFEVKTLDNKMWKLAEKRGKVVLLCFWRMNQSWTEIECSYFKSTYEAFGADERFVMMSLVTKPRSPKAPQMSLATKTRIVKELQQYVTRYGLNWNHAFMDEQTEQQLRAAYGVRRRPSVILIGPDGKILARNLKGKATKWAVEKAFSSSP
jgi:peroxiredoxin